MKSWNLKVILESAFHSLKMLENGTLREVGCTNLLRDTTCFTSLDIRSSEFVKNESLSSVDVAKDTENGTSELDSADLLLLLSFEYFLFSSLLLGLSLFKKFLSLLL